MRTTTTPTVTLNNGVEMPILEYAKSSSPDVLRGFAATCGSFQ